MITVTTKVRFTTGKAGRRRLDTPTKPPLTIQAGRTPRISKLMALAIKFEGMLRDGVVEDQSELAKLARVTQPRMTQIMNLLSLAPDIQQELLFMPPIAHGRDPVHERMLRAICAQPIWEVQRQRWKTLRHG
jgi:hypothetical protein